MPLSSPIIDGDLARRSGRFPKSSPPPDLEPHIPADGNFKAEVENGPPGCSLDGDPGQISAMLWNSSLTDTNTFVLPDPPPGLQSEAKVEDNSKDLGPYLPTTIRGPGGQIAYVEYRPPTSAYRKENSGTKYPEMPPDYDMVLRDHKGMFYHPYIKRYGPCLVAWRFVK